jgi:F-type H+-transporting ATPase subunit delta
MRNTLLADRYASALRMAIGDIGRLDDAAGALNVLSEAYEANPELRFALANPVLEKEKRAQILDAALASQNAPVEVNRLLKSLIEQNRITLLPTIATQFETHIDDWLDRVEVTIVTAVPLTDDLEKKLVDSLQKFTHKTVRLKSRVDAKIIGGLIVLMWGVFIDFSIKTRLERLKQALLAEETPAYGD